MSKKDYQLVADAIKQVSNDPALTELTPQGLMQVLAFRLARDFHCDNERFKEGAFVKACGFNY